MTLNDFDRALKVSITTARKDLAALYEHWAEIDKETQAHARLRVETVLWDLANEAREEGRPDWAMKAIDLLARD